MKSVFKNKVFLVLTIWVGSMTMALAQQPSLQYNRPNDKEGINVFETSKDESVEFDGVDVKIGAHFTQQWQNLSHTNTADAVMENGENVNELAEIGAGFNLATANLNLDAQLAEGVRVSLTTYLSSRHHPETWVKGGYLQVDELGMLNSPALDALMEYVTIRAGHMEINYGDMHFRRTDNGNAMYNPLVGNYIMDAFVTEIGGEVYFKKDGLLAMAALSGGELSGGVTNPDERSPSFYGKLGYDSQVSEALRLRLTGSMYTTNTSTHLYFGDRTGSRYYSVMGGGFTSGRVAPRFGEGVTAFMINPFVKFNGLELFGTYESAGTDARTWDQLALDLVYRFPPNENLYIAGRFNQAGGQLPGPPTANDVTVNRVQAGIGWFLTDNILLKGEYVKQNYKDYPSESILNGGTFDGLMIEGVIGF